MLMDDLGSAITMASANRSRLVFLPAGCFGISDQPEVVQVNINKTLSELLINVPRSERARSVAVLVRNLINDAPSEVVQLYGLEILFDRSLAVDPIRLLEVCAKKKTLLVCWPGEMTNTGLRYAVPSHPEYRRYRVLDLNEAILLADDSVRH